MVKTSIKKAFISVCWWTELLLMIKHFILFKRINWKSILGIKLGGKKDNGFYANKLDDKEEKKAKDEKGIFTLELVKN